MHGFPSYLYTFYLEFLVFQEEDVAVKQSFQAFKMGHESGWPRFLASHDLTITAFFSSSYLGMPCWSKVLAKGFLCSTNTSSV